MIASFHDSMMDWIKTACHALDFRMCIKCWLYSTQDVNVQIFKCPVFLKHMGLNYYCSKLIPLKKTKKKKKP